MDKFSIGAIVLAVLIEAFLVYGAFTNTNENMTNLLKASILPAVLVGTVFLVHYLQRGET